MELTKALRLALDESLCEYYTKERRENCIDKHAPLKGEKPGVTDPTGCSNPDCAFCDALSDMDHFRAIYLQMGKVTEDPSDANIKLLIKLLSYDQAGNPVDEE